MPWTPQFGSTAANLSTFAGGSLSASAPQQSYNFYVGESQLFQFLLSASGIGAPAGSAVQMTIKDQNGNVVYTLTADAGDTVSSDALLLTPGAYTLSFTVLGPAGRPRTDAVLQLDGRVDQRPDRGRDQ